MSIKKRRILTIVACIMLLAGCITAYAAVESSNGLKSIVNTGGINIDVDTYHMVDNEKEPIDEQVVVDYYGEASYIPTITNQAEDCYIRLDITANTETQNIDILKNLLGVNEEFKKIGDHLYLVRPLEHLDSVDLCTGFDVPDEWDYMTSNDMQVKIDVDAIQAKNFAPDFDAEDPWGDVDIIESTIEDNYTVNTAGEEEGEDNIKIVYANKIDGITFNTDNFFKDITFMPGDEYSDKITIDNNTGRKATILFKTEYEESPLLDTLQLKIDNGNDFYSGPLASESLTEYKEIATIDKNAQKTINVDLAMPASVTNEYQTLEDDVTWYFAVEQEEKAVKTGDSFPIALVAAALIVAAGAIGVILFRGRKKA